MIIDKNSQLWLNFSDGQKGLLSLGEYLLEKVVGEGKYHFSDYSFVVFPFAKAYEGFLKKTFLDAGFISHLDYISDHFRLGKVLSPHLVEKLGERSVYKKMVDSAGEELAHAVWETWKSGRNEVFHYFPHNVRSLTHEAAISLIKKTIATMELVVKGFSSDSHSI